MAIKKTDEYKNFQIEGVAGIDTEGPYQGLGFFYRTKVTDKKGKLNPSPWTYDDLNPKVQKYFQKIVKYCKDNGIELICVTTPIPPSSVVSGAANEADTYFKQICDENNVRYIDGNLIKNEILNVSDDDFSDWEGHMNGELAEQFSELLTDILKKDDCSEYFYSSYDECIEAIKARGNE